MKYLDDNNDDLPLETVELLSIPEPDVFEFFVCGKPRPQPRPRFNKGRVVSFGSPDIRAWRKVIYEVCKQELAAAPSKPFFPFGARLELAFFMPIKDKKKHGLAATTRPDADNLAKAVMDSMSDAGMLPGDDACVADLLVTKRYAPENDGGVHIKLFPLKKF